MLPFINNNSQQTMIDEFLSGILVRENGKGNWTKYKVQQLDEDSKMKNTDRVVSKLFKSIRNKTMSLDFNDIDASKGDFKKLKGYSDIENAIKYLNNLINSNNKNIKSNQDFIKAVQAVTTSFNMVLKYQKEFSTAYVIRNVPIKYFYDSICIALIQGTAFIISSSIEFVKEGAGMTQQVNPHKNLMKNNYIKAIIKINELDKNNKIRTLFKDLQHYNEGVIASTLFVISLIGIGFSLMKAIIFTYYNTRIKLANYLLTLKNYVLLNATTVADKNVKEKQEKIAEKLQKLSDLINVDQNVASSRADEEINDDNDKTAEETSDDDGDFI